MHTRTATVHTLTLCSFSVDRSVVTPRTGCASRAVLTRRAPAALVRVASASHMANSNSNATSDPLWIALNRVTAVTAQYVTAGFFRRNGHSGQVPKEIEMLRQAALGTLVGEAGPISSGRPRVVCEIGFNAGHSATVSARARSPLLPPWCY